MVVVGAMMVSATGGHGLLEHIRLYEEISLLVLEGQHGHEALQGGGVVLELVTQVILVLELDVQRVLENFLGISGVPDKVKL